jgi:hypothetical protein
VLYAITFYFLAGGITGSIFKIRTLLLVLICVLGEFSVSGIVNGGLAVAWLAASLTAVQAGFVAGMVARGVYEEVGYLHAGGR